MPSRAASVTSVSGRSAPSRNENADCACNSTNIRHATISKRARRAAHAGIAEAPSVIDAVEEPVVRHVVVGEATERAIVEQQIPLVTRPAPRVPPLAGDAPRPG